jgi:hypothetical protein
MMTNGFGEAAMKTDAKPTVHVAFSLSAAANIEQPWQYGCSILEK